MWCGLEKKHCYSPHSSIADNHNGRGRRYILEITIFLMKMNKDLYKHTINNNVQDALHYSSENMIIVVVCNVYEWKHTEGEGGERKRRRNMRAH